MPDKKCPKCGLWNSDYAMICDCGFQFPEPSKEKIRLEESEGDVGEDKLPDIKCPECGLWNAGSASACDCGFDLTQIPEAKSGEEQAEEPPPPDTAPPFGRLPPISTFSDLACVIWVKNLFRLAFTPNEETIQSIDKDSRDNEWAAVFMSLIVMLIFPIVQFIISFVKSGSGLPGCVSCLVSGVFSNLVGTWLPILGFSILLGISLRRNQPETKFYLPNALYFGTLLSSIVFFINLFGGFISSLLPGETQRLNTTLSIILAAVILFVMLGVFAYLFLICFRLLNTLASPVGKSRIKRILLCAIAVLLATIPDHFFGQELYSLPILSDLRRLIFYNPSLFYVLWIIATAWMIRKTSIPVKGWLLVSLAGWFAGQILTRLVEIPFLQSSFLWAESTQTYLLGAFLKAVFLSVFTGIQWLYMRRFIRYSRALSVLWPLGFILAGVLPARAFFGCQTAFSILALYGLPGVLLVYWFPPDDPTSWPRIQPDNLAQAWEKFHAAVDRAWNRPLGD